MLLVVEPPSSPDSRRSVAPVLDGGKDSTPGKRAGPMFLRRLEEKVKARFHEPTNHDDERNKTADEWKLTKSNRSVNISRRWPTNVFGRSIYYTQVGIPHGDKIWRKCWAFWCFIAEVYQTNCRHIDWQ